MAPRTGWAREPFVDGGDADGDHAPPQPVGGVVEFVGSPSFVGMRADDAMYMLIHGYNDMMFATAHYFDDRDRTVAGEAEETPSPET